MASVSSEIMFWRSSSAQPYRAGAFFVVNGVPSTRATAVVSSLWSAGGGVSSDEVVPDVPVGVDGVVEAVWGVAGVVEDLGEGEVSGGGFAEEVAESGEGGVSAGGAFCGFVRRS